MLAIARIDMNGEIVWCSSNWPYLTGFSFMKTIGSKAQELLPGYQWTHSDQAQKIRLLHRWLFVHTFQLADSQVLIVEDRHLVEGSVEPKAAKQPVTTQGVQKLLYELPSPGMKGVLSTIAKVAISDATVLLYGETGVGKEGIAQLIHETSRRAAAPYVKLNCGAIPESLIESELFGYAPGAFTGAERTGKKGVFEEADTGTLFLDEIAELPMASQVKLLRVLQEGSFKKIGQPRAIQVDVRIIAATNRKLEAEVAAGRFREDLYYRLCVLPIDIPALRERAEDIYPLVQFFLEKFAAKYGSVKAVTPRALSALMKYSWPGNVRQLENVIERLVLLAEGDEIPYPELPASIREAVHEPLILENNGPLQPVPETGKGIKIDKILPLKEATSIVEKELLRMAREVSSSTYEIAAMLGVDQSTVSRKLKQITI